MMPAAVNIEEVKPSLLTMVEDVAIYVANCRHLWGVKREGSFAWFAREH